MESDGRTDSPNLFYVIVRSDIKKVYTIYGKIQVFVRVKVMRYYKVALNGIVFNESRNFVERKILLLVRSATIVD